MKQGYFRLQAAVLASASVVGKKEHDGPLGGCFDLHDPDDLFGKKTWEGAESESQRMAFRLALSKAGLRDGDGTRRTAELSAVAGFVSTKRLSRRKMLLFAISRSPGTRSFAALSAPCRRKRMVC